MGLRFAEEVYTFQLKEITTRCSKNKGRAIADPAFVAIIVYGLLLLIALLNLLSDSW